MKIDGKMSYKDFVFPINPYLLKITHKRGIASEKIPYGKSTVNDLGESSRIISGEGEFCGESCIRDFLGLKDVMDRGGGGMLYIPSQKPIYAVFESLELIGSDIAGVVSYSFRFVESFERTQEEIRYTINGDGKSSLWDISYIHGIHIDQLVLLNPHIRRPDLPIEAWKRVKLC